MTQASKAQLQQAIQDLPDHLTGEVLQFIDFLVFRSDTSDARVKKDMVNAAVRSNDDIAGDRVMDPDEAYNRIEEKFKDR